MQSFSASLLSRLAGALPAERAAGYLPASSGFGFELGLSGVARRGPDISVRLEPEDNSFRLLDGPPLAEAICRFWDDVDSADARAIDALWLEYDDPGPDRPWTPSLGFCRLTGDFTEEFLDRLLPLIGGERDLLDQILQRLTPLASLRQIGFPLGRHTSALRLCFTTTRQEIGTCLDRLGQSAGKQALLPILEELATDPGEIVLHLDVGHALGPRIGADIMPGGHSGWEHLLEGLLEHGLCSEADAALIRRWPSSPDILRDPLASLSRRLPDPSRWDEAIVLRRANHVKISAEPDRPLGVKAYLFAGLLWDQQIQGAA